MQVKLATGCGWCLTAWTLEGTVGAIVDEKVIDAPGVDPVNWWQTPADLVGTGAYKLTSYTPKQSMVFSQVPNWWGSPKPTLKTINIDIKDPSTAPTTVDAFFQKGYDIIGYGGNSANIPLANVLAIQANSREKPDLLVQPKGRTTWLSFNIGYPSTGGPFLGETAAAKGLRLAFDLAVDKQGLATTVCHNLICSAATGGLITTGLVGNGGPNSDPLAKFDPTQAKSLLKQYDPTGSLTKNLTYSYNAGSLNESVAEYLQNEWKTNLGVKVNLNSVSDASIFINNRLSGKYEMSRDGWQFDYNHPQDWYDNLWGAIPTAEGANTSGFDDPTVRQHPQAGRRGAADDSTSAVQPAVADPAERRRLHPALLLGRQLPDPALREGRRFEHRLRPLLGRDLDPGSLTSSTPPRKGAWHSPGAFLFSRISRTRANRARSQNTARHGIR